MLLFPIRITVYVNYMNINILYVNELKRIKRNDCFECSGLLRRQSEQFETFVDLQNRS